MLRRWLALLLTLLLSPLLADGTAGAAETPCLADEIGALGDQLRLELREAAGEARVTGREEDRQGSFTSALTRLFAGEAWRLGREASADMAMSEPLLREAGRRLDVARERVQRAEEEKGRARTRRLLERELRPAALELAILLDAVLRADALAGGTKR